MSVLARGGLGHARLRARERPSELENRNVIWESFHPTPTSLSPALSGAFIVQ